MSKKLFIVLFILFCAISGPVFSDDLNELLNLLEENVFSVQIIGRIYDSGQVSSWEAEVAKYTISGRKISVKLEGDALVVIADITPYVDDEDGILLVAQGQVWVDTPEEPMVKYTSAMKSLPIQFGDKVYFYPLGVSKDYNSEMFILELEIQILPYKNIARSDQE